MLATLQKFKQEFGSVEAYLENVLKLDDSTVGVIKENLLRPW
jgi:hypothetical protein